MKNRLFKKSTIIPWLVLTLVMLAVTIARPRVCIVIFFIYCVIRTIIAYVSKEERKPIDVCRSILYHIAAFAAIFWCFGSFFSLCFPYRASYEYRFDIAELKEQYSEALDFFPDKIPKGAQNIEWKWVPGMLQGSEKTFKYC